MKIRALFLYPLFYIAVTRVSIFPLVALE
ncbi:hypothetical protein DBR43_27950 [Pedobacter sp. KBW06]|nr:hypothetical protein DBR43_27950 [Pedobacter sp. KBW06]